MKANLIFLSILLSCLSIWAEETDTVYLSQTEVTGLFKTASKSYPGVHDPSLVYDRNGHTYIFGSHNAIARTSDMMNWTGVGNANLYGRQGANGAVTACNFNDAFVTNMTKKVTILKNGQPEEVTFGNFDARAWHCAIPNPDNGAAWTVAGNMWAPDVIWNEQMKTWCMYLSLNGPRWNSVIILLTSKNIEGPYVYQGPVVYTGFNNTDNPNVSWKLTDLELVIGEQKTLPGRYNLGNGWGNYMPHAIDPCVFYDKEGQLWMSYGSWSGGIFILKLNNENGLRDYTATYPLKTDAGGHPLSDPYFGTQLAGGYYVSGEGSYIERMGDYYYLFVTYGGLEAKGGYTMRTFRSKNPDGPYTDNSGESAIFDRYHLNYGSGDGIRRGNLLVGAFADWSYNQPNGEVAQGHNSAITDEKGRTLLIYHTRFNTGNEWFQDRVHQLFTNEKGWLLSAPMEFNGETITNEDFENGCEFTEEQIPGEYQTLIHTFGLNQADLETAKPLTITLTDKGRVTGDKSGTWKMKEGTAYITLTVGGVAYYGVVVEQTLDGTNMKCIGITASSQDGQMLWAYSVEPLYAIAYNAQTATDPIKNNATYSTHIDLSSNASYGVEITWESSIPEIISNTGKYSPADTTTYLTMTKRIAKGNYVFEKSFNIKAAKAEELPGDYLSGLVAYYDFDAKPAVNRLDEEQRISMLKLTSGTTPILQEDGARVGTVGHIFEGTIADKTASYMRMPNPLQNSELKAFTVSMWVKRGNAKDLKGTAWAFTEGVPTSKAEQSRLFYTLNNYMSFTNMTDTFAINYPKTASTIIPEKEWKLVTVTLDESNVTIYVNGLKRSVSSFASTAGKTIADFDMSKVLETVASAEYFTLGLGNGLSSAEADYDDLLIYNRALSAEDVKLLFSMEKRVTDYSKIPNEETRIESIAEDTEANEYSLSNQQFDLFGRHIQTPTKPGIYVKGGKKFLVK